MLFDLTIFKKKINLSLECILISRVFFFSDTVVPIRSRGSQRFRAISATQDNAAIEKQPLLFKKTRETSKSNRNEVVVTAIIENHSESIRQKDSASESTIS